MAKSLVTVARSGSRLTEEVAWPGSAPATGRIPLENVMVWCVAVWNRPDRAAPIARGQSSPGLYHWNVPYGDGSVVIPHGSHDFRNGCAVPQGHPDGRARGCFAPGRLGRRDFAGILDRPTIRITFANSILQSPGRSPGTYPSPARPSRIPAMKSRQAGYSSPCQIGAMRASAWSADQPRCFMACSP